MTDHELTPAQWLAVLVIVERHCINPALIAAVEAAWTHAYTEAPPAMEEP